MKRRGSKRVPPPADDTPLRRQTRTRGANAVLCREKSYKWSAAHAKNKKKVFGRALDLVEKATAKLDGSAEVKRLTEFKLKRDVQGMHLATGTEVHAVEGLKAGTARLLVKPCENGYFTLEHVGLTSDTSRDTLLSLLRVLSTRRALCMRSVHVLCFKSVGSFDDICMGALVDVLTAHPQIFSLNMGEKPRVTAAGWAHLLAHLQVGHIVCLFVDTIYAGAECVSKMKDAIAGTRRRKDGSVRPRAGRREQLETEAQKLLSEAREWECEAERPGRSAADCREAMRSAARARKAAARRAPWRTARMKRFAQNHPDGEVQGWGKPLWRPKVVWAELGQ